MNDTLEGRLRALPAIPGGGEMVLLKASHRDAFADWAGLVEQRMESLKVERDQWQQLADQAIALLRQIRDEVQWQMLRELCKAYGRADAEEAEDGEQAQG